MDQPARHDETGRDVSRHTATDPDYEFSLSIDEVADRYAAAGHPRTARSIQRYCANNNLDCRKVPTHTGEIYRVAPYSVARHIAQTDEIIAATGDTTSRATSRQVADERHDRDQSPAAANVAEEQRQDATRRDVSGQGSGQTPAEAAHNARYIEQLEKRIEEKEDQITFLQEELKDRRDQFRGMKDIISEQKTLLQSMNAHMAPIFEALAGALEKGTLRAPAIGTGRVHQTEESRLARAIDTDSQNDGLSTSPMPSDAIDRAL